ncbi:MAG: hypothetical protein HUK12_10445 [Muribaculaceae bacterium]|nr:hypothetical protein [Muribaculaceae bacterium]
MNKEKLQGTFLCIGLLMILCTAAMPLLGILPQYLNWERGIYAAGALIVLVVRITEVYRGSNKRVKRLHHIEKVSAVLFCASAFLLIYKGHIMRYLSGNDWVTFMLAAAALQIYTSFAIDRAERKGK